MFLFKKKPGLIALLVCTFVFSLSTNSYASSDEEIAAMRLQLDAMSKRLDQLESDNRALLATNNELRSSSQTATVAVTNVTEPSPSNTPDTQTVHAKAPEHRADATDQKESPKEPAKTSSWTDRIRWAGDFRYRYEYIDIHDRDSRNRSRIRARAHLIADITPDIVVGFGFASGGDDPVSSNQTLGRAGSSKGLNIDLAYFNWTANEDTNVVAGKFQNYLYRPGGSQFLWDSDWRPEGMGLIWDNDVFFANGLGTWIESDSDNQESFAYALQAGVKLPIGDNIEFVAGVGYNVFDVKGLGSIYGDVDDFYGNSFNPITQTYLYDYEELELFADVTFDVFSKPLLLYADYVQNQATNNHNTGYIFGFNYGKASDKGQWSVSYAYEKLEADAAFGLLTSSDFGIGGTDAEGSIFNANYAIHKGVNAVATYFITDVGIRTPNPVNVNRLQLDLSFRYK